VSDFALLGGAPAFAKPLHVGRPNVGDRERLLERIGAAVDSRWLTNDGPLVREFEQAVAAALDVPHCIAMCNGTVALEIAIRAAGLRGEVIVSPFTFVATAHALQWQQIKPVFCDIDPQTHNIDPERIEELITPRTTGILAVHLWGRPAPVEALTEIADRHGLRLLFDAAHAFGCSYAGRMIGGFDTAEVLSFHATKVINSFEGGAIVTGDERLADVARLMRNHGFADYDLVTHVGTNGKLSEVGAAMGLTSLESSAEFVAVNRRNHEAYRAGLASLDSVELLPFDAGERCNWQYAVIEVGDDAPLSRDEVQRVLWAENVHARRYFFPGCHRMEPYRSLFPEVAERLPQTDRVAQQVLALPTGTSVTPEAIATITGLIGRALADAARLRRALGTAGTIQSAQG
jgi:dTDP-4-amino-4,6-dideoxygalactose transaminase